MTMDPLNQELQRLKERLERGEMTPAEYEKAWQRLRESAGQGQSADPFETSAYHPLPSTRLTNLAPGLEMGPEDHRFRLVRKIGGGAMGQVWQAHDLVEEELEGGERYKALKVVNPQLQDLARALKMLKREAVRASQLTHPNIINVRGCRQGKDGWLFVVMDYLEGRDLDRLLLEDGKPGLSWERTRELLKPLAEGLDYAHTQGVLHRDLKPGNVFITHEGQVKLLDFGLAYRLHQASTLMKVEEPDTSGTPEYMPPEAFVAGEPDKSRDIYALACLTYEMFTGEPPYNPQAAVQRQPDLMPGKPEGLTDAAWEVLQSGLAYHKKNRPESAGELVRRLQEAQSPGGMAKVEVVPRPLEEEDAGKTLSPVPFIHGWSEEQVQALQRETAKTLGFAVDFRDKLQDGRPGPEMVIILAGRFLMGSPEDEPERSSDERQHEVTIQQPFAMGKYAVTFEEFDYFLQATGQSASERSNRFRSFWGFGAKAGDMGWGRGRRPVINISWQDALEYVEWLSAQTGQKYRLPMEAEWEYAARAGTTTPFYFGKTINTHQANYDGNYTYAGGPKGEYRQKTVEVGAFPSNAWGLYEVHGNVWEWTCSEYDQNYSGAETRCVGKNGGLRVIRGGSWYYGPPNVRSANRLGNRPDGRYYSLGFRLARDL